MGDIDSDMDLTFLITNETLYRTDNTTVIHHDYNNYTCHFDFSEEWDNLDKIIIFKDGWNNKITIHLSENETECPLPNRMLQGSYFKTIVECETLKTNTLSIPLSFHQPTTSSNTSTIDDEYEYDPPNTTGCSQDTSHDCNTYEKCSKNEEDAIFEIFNTLETLYDKVVYEDKQLLFYNKNNLLETISLPFLNQGEIEDLVENKIVSRLSNAYHTIAFTGDYNDLENVPVEFNPSPHNHTVNDVVDYNSDLNMNLGQLLDLLSDEIRKE